MPKLFNESPAFTTSDLVNALSRERDKKLPVRSSFFNALVPQVSAQDAAVNRPDPVERASMLPFATYPDGSTRLALPGMIAEDIPRAFTAPARAYRGEIPDEDMISEGLNFAGNMAMTGSIAPKPSNAAGMFGGRLTGSADNAAIARSLDTDIARQIHEAQRLANPEADPNRLAQIEKRGPYYEVSSPVGNVRAKDVPDGVQITSSRLDPDVPRGMGYGTPLYEMLAQGAAAAGKPLASDQIVSRPAQNVYGAMSRRGYEVQGPPANALRHPDSGSLIANEPIYSVSAPNVARRDMPPPLPDNAIYANTSEAAAPGVVLSEAGKRIESPIRAYHGSPHENPNTALAPGALTAQAAEQARTRVTNQMTMDAASRAARAKQMGFDTDTTWYHGTSTPGLTELKPGMRDPGIWVTDDKMNANNYARGSDADLHSLRARYSNPYIVEFGDDMSPTNMGSSIPFDNNVDIVKHAFNNGYDAVHFPYGNFSESGNTLVLRNGNQLRDILAEFDLEKSGSANLLSINPKYSGLAGVMMVDDKNKKKKN